MKISNITLSKGEKDGQTTSLLPWENSFRTQWNPESGKKLRHWATKSLFLVTDKGVKIPVH
jgi:hypothetical protein